MKRIGVGWQQIAHSVDARRVEAHQRNREPGPQLLLELRHHALDGDREDALAAAALDELAQQHAGFDRLAETCGVRHQDPLARLVERHNRRIELIRQVVYRRAVRDVQIGVSWRRLTQQAFEIQAGVAVLRRRVGDEHGVRRIERSNVFAFDLRQKPRFLVSHDLRHADD